MYLLRVVFGTIVGIFMENTLSASVINRIKSYRKKKLYQLQIKNLDVPGNVQLKEERKQSKPHFDSKIDPVGSFERMKEEINGKISKYLSKF